MLTKLATDIIKEAAMAEEFNTSDLVSDELKTSYNECVSNMPIISKNLVGYKAEMVPVFNHESAYYVELDSVSKYMSYADIKDIAEAMENIAEANDISVSSMSLVIESKEYMESVMESAIAQSKAGDKSLLENCELSIKLINMLESEGINVVLTR